ncbi:hypothetical protein niasHT_033077 [Heterodera trifolii]|uniref:Uncharacterized protein n=1 Tax=Heterodera trifolii TaxID=157864 RepID=A0ABD2ISZ8_9BILA
MEVEVKQQEGFYLKAIVTDVLENSLDVVYDRGCRKPETVEFSQCRAVTIENAQQKRPSKCGDIVDALVPIDKNNDDFQAYKKMKIREIKPDISIWPPIAIAPFSSSRIFTIVVVVGIVLSIISCRRFRNDEQQQKEAQEVQQQRPLKNAKLQMGNNRRTARLAHANNDSADQLAREDWAHFEMVERQLDELLEHHAMKLDEDGDVLGVDMVADPLNEVCQAPKIGRALLRLDPERDVKAKIFWLVKRCGVPEADIGPYLTRNPYFLLQSFDDLKAQLDYLQFHRFSRQQIAKLVVEYRYWLNSPQERIDARLGWLQRQFYLRADELRLAIVKEPRLIQFGVGPIQGLILALNQTCGFSQQCLQRIVLKDPRVFLSEKPHVLTSFNYLAYVMRITNEQIVFFQLLLKSANQMYLCCANKYPFIPLLNEFGLPDHYSSWYRMTLLHIWMALCRVQQSLEAMAYIYFMHQVLEVFNTDWYTRLDKAAKEMGMSVNKRKEGMALHAIYISTLHDYDEGFFGDDRVLAAAVWRSFFLQLPDVSPAQINRVVRYMRATVRFFFHELQSVQVQVGGRGMASLARMDDTRLLTDGIERWDVAEELARLVSAEQFGTIPAPPPSSAMDGDGGRNSAQPAPKAAASN